MTERNEVSVKELRYIVDEAKSPSDLIELLPRMGLSYELVDALSELWLKNYDIQEDKHIRKKFIAEGQQIAKELNM